MRRCPLPVLAGLTLALLLSACGGGGDDSAAAAGERESAAANLTAHKLPICPAPTTAVPLTAITAVQGSGAASPLQSEIVAVRGIVTADWRGSERLNGFFVQQPDADNDRATSEGLFVFAPGNATPLAVGDYVQIEGRVTEFQRSGERASLTQIANPTAVVVCGPAEPVKPATLTLPVKDAAELESVEGMLVRFQQPLYVSGNFTLGRFGELLLSP